jgi:Fe-S-cluster containining protein
MQNGETHKTADELPPVDCFRCGVCCVRYRPKVEDWEILTITSKLGISREAFVHSCIRTLPKSGERMLDNGANQCPFLRWLEHTGRAGCTIHTFRPQACLNWQASLLRTECQDGLRKLKPEKGIILPKDMYSSQQEIDELNCILIEEPAE